MKRFISVLIVAVIVFTTFGVAASALKETATVNPVAGRSVGDNVYFGSYPQSKVTDSNLIEKLNEIEKDWTSYDYCSKAINSDEGTITISNFMNYCDITYQSEKYRAVFFTNYRPSTTSDDPVADKSRQDDNGYNTDTVYYFKFEPLKWKVLDPNQGYLICLDVIDSQPYNNFLFNSGGAYFGDSDHFHYATDWEYSTLRAWLNGHFYDTAFSSAEKEAIGSTHLENKSTYPNTAYDYNMTLDKIFIPSYDDMRNPAYGFNNSISSFDSNRRAKGTDYARCQGLYEVNTLLNVYSNPNWRLRTNDGSATIYNVNNYGAIYSYFQTNNTSYGIRPALKFAPEEIINKVTFDACGGKVSEVSREVTTGSALIALPQAQREGYNFDGWYSAAEGGYKIQEGEIVDDNMTVYAHWSTYPVRFRLEKKPSKIVYALGEEFDITGADMRLENANGTYRELLPEEVELIGFDSTKYGQQKVYLSHTQDEKVFNSYTFTLIVGKEVSDIYVTHKPNKTLYIMGEPFEREGMVITAVYSDGSVEDVTNLVRTSGYESTSPGIKKMTVSYTYKDKTVTTQFSYQMNPKLRSISIEQLPDKTEYVKGEPFDRTGLVVYAHFSDDSVSDITKLFRTSGFTTKTPGEKVMSVYYNYGTQTRSQEFTINVVEEHTVPVQPQEDRVVNNIYVTQKPAKTAYFEGDEFVQDGLNVVASYSDGTTEDVTENILVTGFDSSTCGIKKITVSYTYKEVTVTTQFSYQVEPTLESVSIEHLPDKTEYVKGEPFDRTGLVVYAHFSDESTKDITNLFRTTGFTTKTPGEKVMTVYYVYGDKTCSQEFTINVVEKHTDDIPLQ